YLSPILARYVDEVARELEGVPLYFMQSNGGLTDARRFRGKDAILSGPAGGIVGAAKSAAAAGFDRIIGFDMGGTSTDVSHYAGSFERSFETEIAGVRFQAPMLRINSVAAGGGSICRFDGARLRVGPQSAGADPGPTCYRRGGPLTVTDANLLLGKVAPDFFPHVFGRDGDQPLDAAIVAEKFATLAAEVARATGRALSPHELAEGFVTIAVENMANAIKQISIRRGHDVTDHTLATFGGAGGQHACRVADALGMARVVIHPLAGVLSAYGIGRAELRALRQQTIETRLEAGAMPRIDAALAPLAETVRAELAAQGVAAGSITVERRLRVKYDGTDSTLPVAHGDLATITTAFAAAHQAQFGFTSADKPLMVEAVMAEAIGASDDRPPPPADARHASAQRPIPLATVEIFTNGTFHGAPVYDREALWPGALIDGPALLAEATATTIIEPGWQARIDGRRNLVMERVVLLPRQVAMGTEADPVMLEIFNNLFMAIAEEMGVALQNTAYSVNIKERLDFSCALFDAKGALIANAPHMPVHLGSMGESVAAVIRARTGAMKPGEAYMLNAPYNGGTHLPDVTVIMPVFEEPCAGPTFYVAARGHQADIGGISPGSMPPLSRTVEEEGILIDDFLLVEAGHIREAELLALLGAGPYPARNPQQ
ncbi:MAG: hydantoinase/oxoprolinase family protein, partial [Stellaceae bacterium]